MNQDHNPYAAPLAELVDVADPNSDAEAIRREHINHEASVRFISLLYFLPGSLFAVGTLLALATATSVLFRGDQGMPGPSELTLMLLASVIAAGLATLFIAIGIGLRRLSQWVRIPVGMLSGVGLLGVPIGTLINGLILYLLFCKKGNMVFSDEYKEIIRQTPHIKPQTSWVVMALLILVLLLFAIVILAAIFG